MSQPFENEFRLNIEELSTMDLVVGYLDMDEIQELEAEFQDVKTTVREVVQEKLQAAWTSPSGETAQEYLRDAEKARREGEKVQQEILREKEYMETIRDTVAAVLADRGVYTEASIFQ